MKIVFMGTPEFSVSALQKLHDEFEVIAVYTQPDKPVGRGLEVKASPVKRVAQTLGIPVFQPKKLTEAGEFEKLQAIGADIIVVAAYGQILKKNVLELPRLGCVNIHSSLLPRWRGAAPIQWAIMSGDHETGITTMKMAEKLDAGDIYLQKKTPINDMDTAETMHDRLSVIGSELIIETVRALESGALKSQVQDESLVTYAHKLTKEMEVINPELDAKLIDCQIRALNPWPGTSLILVSGERIKVKKARIARGVQSQTSEVNVSGDQVVLGCKTGCVELLEVQLEGKKAMQASSFINGLKGQGKHLPLKVKIS
ncbi:MAG: methionyl-tRNA formyltransferase [Xanthomonadaceae bacterium]|nr:methionyl-tRNA formyltransferase [Xanthomonadaceae bacterium]